MPLSFNFCGAPEGPDCDCCLSPKVFPAPMFCHLSGDRCHRRKWAGQQEGLFDGQVSKDEKDGWEGAGAWAWEMCGIPVGGSGRETSQQLGRFAGEETEVGRGGGPRSGSSGLSAASSLAFPAASAQRASRPRASLRAAVLTVSSAAAPGAGGRWAASRTDSSRRGENGIKHKPAVEMARMVG